MVMMMMMMMMMAVMTGGRSPASRRRRDVRESDDPEKGVHRLPASATASDHRRARDAVGSGGVAVLSCHGGGLDPPDEEG